MERPLKDVPEAALYVLHRSIEKSDRLITNSLVETIDGNIEVCALGTTLNPRERESFLKAENWDYMDYDNRWKSTGATADDLWNIADLNNDFNGTNEKRREFMLRHIVGELRHRSLSVNKPAGIKNSDPERVAIGR